MHSTHFAFTLPVLPGLLHSLSINPCLYIKVSSVCRRDLSRDGFFLLQFSQGIPSPFPPDLSTSQCSLADCLQVLSVSPMLQRSVAGDLPHWACQGASCQGATVLGFWRAGLVALFTRDNHTQSNGRGDRAGIPGIGYNGKLRYTFSNGRASDTITT